MRDDDSVPSEPSAVGGLKSAKGKTIEQRYQKKTPLEHVLHRPESYIGSAEPDSQAVWVFDDVMQRMEFRSITYVPGLYKIFDEILVNAADVKARELHEGNKLAKSDQMTCIKVDIQPENNVISVYNDGAGIPVEVHKEHKIYVPELIFGHLLTSDNYDDAEQRVTGGRNGYGAKLTNIFSKEFTVECADSARNRKFKKTWTNNMTISSPCKITPYSESKSYVKVTFSPDLHRFKLGRLEPDFVSLLTKRVYDIAGCCSGVRVWLNGKRLTLASDFKSYVDLYFKKPPVVKRSMKLEEPDSAVSSPGGSNSESASAGGGGDGAGYSTASNLIKIHEKADRWEIVVCQSDGQFQQVSFVNNICTAKGGTHVNYVAEPLVQAIMKKVNAKNKGGMEIKPHQVKSHLWLFVNCLIVNPTFDSQAKETMTLKVSQFGSKFTPSERTVNAIVKSDIVDSVLLWAKTKQQVELQRKMKGKKQARGGRDRILDIPKLDDANLAGTKQSENCTLILTEGESAKTSCVAGLSVVGKDKYGVYPLRGKMLNVREASFKQQVENAEIQAILRVMGLEVGKKIDSPKGLRYGKLMIMTDQDLDGSHIKGLLINMVAHYWPQLLQYRGFLKEFVTPIVKVWKGNRELAFFTLREYQQWKESHEDGKGWKIKYYKGLGTSTDQEFMAYFSQLEKHTLDFIYSGDNDFDAIDMAFNGKRAEDRKQWIQAYNEILAANGPAAAGVDHSQSTLSYSDFVHKELVLFSRYDVERSIPNCVDGLKPVQRKVLFAVFKKNLKQENKVAQLVGYIGEKTAYHHGETSLGTTIISMAQNFVGSNNINLLEPCGQFGSRKEGGKDASAMRYIFTKLSPITRKLFPECDDPLLEYQNDDGLMVEPKTYIPVIPLALVNGAEGIGTGWSCSVPNFNPRDVIANIRRFLAGDPLEPMIPWYRGFIGKIERKTANSFESVGIIEKLDEETIVIKELPIRVWTQPYKAWLEELVQAGLQGAENEEPPAVGGGRGRGRGAAAGGATATRAASSTVRSDGFSITEFVDHSTHKEVHFIVKMNATQMARAEREGLEKVFRLRRPIATSNMTLFDPQGKVQKYATELDVMREFGQLRLQYYELRKKHRLEALERECRILKNKAAFINMLCHGQLSLANKKQAVITSELSAKGLEPMSVIEKSFPLLIALESQRRKLEVETKATLEGDENDAAEKDSSSLPPAARDFDYLLKMNFWTLSMERVADLEAELKRKREEAAEFRRKTPEDLWEEDLKAVETELDVIDAADAEEEQKKKKLRAVRRTSIEAARKPAAKRRAAPKKKSVASLYTSDIDDDDSDNSDTSPSDDDDQNLDNTTGSSYQRQAPRTAQSTDAVKVAAATSRAAKPPASKRTALSQASAPSLQTRLDAFSRDAASSRAAAAWSSLNEAKNDISIPASAVSAAEPTSLQPTAIITLADRLRARVLSGSNADQTNKPQTDLLHALMESSSGEPSAAAPAAKPRTKRRSPNSRAIAISSSSSSSSGGPVTKRKRLRAVTPPVDLGASQSGTNSSESYNVDVSDAAFDSTDSE